MARVETRPIPRPGQLWLSCPPYSLVAHIVDVDLGECVVSYALHDDDGSLLEQVTHAALDDGWWRAFQPLVRRFG